MPKYQATYRFKGRPHVLTYDAADWSDAEARMKAFPWAQLDGELVAELTLPKWTDRLGGWLK